MEIVLFVQRIKFVISSFSAILVDNACDSLTVTLSSPSPRVCMLILVFTFDVGKYCNEKKRVFDLLVVEKIMGFLECSFSLPIWLLRKSISGKNFFFFF